MLREYVQCAMCMAGEIVGDVGTCPQGRSQDFAQGGQAFGGPKVSPTKNGKLIGFSPLFWERGPNS